MKKFALLFAIAGLFMFSCSQQPKEVDQIIETFTIAELCEKAAELNGSEVHFEGVIIHVCKHSGEKMFVEMDDAKVRVYLGENQGKITTEDDGKEISIIGKIVIADHECKEAKKDVAEHECDHEKTEEAHVHGKGEEAHVHGEDCDHEKAEEAVKVPVKFHIELTSFEWI
jgi:hypothetical protein